IPTILRNFPCEPFQVTVNLPSVSGKIIKNLPEQDRPREKLLERGAAALSDSEILAIFLGTGKAGLNAVDLGRELLSRFGGLHQLSRASPEQLCEANGIGPAKAAQLCAAFEF